MLEIWKDIPDYEGLYQISTLGKVKSFPRKGTHTTKERIIKFAKSNKGYCIAVLKKNNVQKVFSVHRLVAKAFIPNPDNLPQVNHIDGNKLNNCVDNLEWCTNKQNRQHASQHHLLFTRHIYQFDLNGNFIKEWYSAVEASKFYNINYNSLRSACKSKKGIYKGYIWRYANK